MKQTILEKLRESMFKSDLSALDLIEPAADLIEDQQAEILKLKNEVFETNNLYDAVIGQRDKQAKEIEELKEKYLVYYTETKGE